jgi:hypothetical protein
MTPSPAPAVVPQLDQTTLLKTMLLARMRQPPNNTPVNAVAYQRAVQTLFPNGLPANISAYFQALAATMKHQQQQQQQQRK